MSQSLSSNSNWSADWSESTCLCQVELKALAFQAQDKQNKVNN